MNNDLFYEQIVPADPKVPKAVYVLLMTVSVLFGLFLTVAVTVFALIVLVGLVYALIWVVRPRTSVEYEYCLTNSDLTVDIIYRKEKRASVANIDLRDAGAVNVGRPGSTEGYGKVFDCCGTNMDPSTVCNIGFNRDGSRCLLLFTPDETMTQMMRRIVPVR